MLQRITGFLLILDVAILFLKVIVIMLFWQNEMILNTFIVVN